MNEHPKHVTVDTYVQQAQQSAAAAGILLEAEKATSLEELAERLLLPLHRLGLLRANSGTLWLTATCVSWDEAATLPQKLTRLAVLESSLRSHYEGGVIIDLRWCPDAPSDGQLSRLERFLFDLRSNLCPMILTAPGVSRDVWDQLSALQLQPVTIGQEIQKPAKREIGFERM